mmetsp:Transcript_40570/g.80163  ORF Transcript_40570/g.80163 Transcript_40570/m.80163 type:complete len:96 (+) Transcript_40570:1823-2110(+)
MATRKANPPWDDLQWQAAYVSLSDHNAHVRQAGELQEGNLHREAGFFTPQSPACCSSNDSAVVAVVAAAAACSLGRLHAVAAAAVDLAVAATDAQ